MSQENPVSITAKRKARQLLIEWADGHQSQYSFMLLRAACPCATCRGGHEFMSSEPSEEVYETQLPDNSATMIERIDRVGGYGISILWQDGHSDGIYTWHYLRALCPCEICRPVTE